MHNVPSITNMRARALVIMATRRQDQDLVTEVAEKHGVNEAVDPAAAAEDKDWRGVVPSYGWHPWFSHQIYDDSDSAYRTEDAGKKDSTSEQKDHSGAGDGEGKEDVPKQLTDEQKIAHYSSVLTPSPEDRTFLLALPSPLPLSHLLNTTRARLAAHPLALIGEIGLDRAFRLPEAWLPDQSSNRDDSLTPGGREGRRLSPYRVDMEHQRKVLLAQLRLAGEMGRAVSVHGVQCHGVLFETVRECWKGYEKEVVGKRERKRRERETSQSLEGAGGDAVKDEGEGKGSSDDKKQNLPYPPRLCLHSYSGPPDQAQQYLNPAIPCEIFFSFSMAINFSTAAKSKTEQVIKMMPENRILIESDLHMAGDRMDAGLKGMAEMVCQIKGWEVKDGVKRLKANWMRFVFGEEGGG